MTKYIGFELVEKKKKTAVYSVLQDTLGFKLALGLVKWFPAWRRYCFYPEDEVVFDVSCLKSIIDFIEKLMTERRNEQIKKKNNRNISGI